MAKLRSPFSAVVASALMLFTLALPAAGAPPSIDSAAPLACSELVKNGTFEAVGANWTQEGGNSLQLITDFNPRTGRYSADLGGLPVNNANHRIKQQLTLPAGAIITLTFWWEQDTQETAPVMDDYLAVNLLRTNGTLLKELVRLGARPDWPPWEPLTFDLTAYAGQTVALQFQGVTDAINGTEFFVDDVSVTVCTRLRTYLPLIRR